MSGGACFSPVLNPRPQYPPFTDVLKSFLLRYTKTPLTLTLATMLAYPYYLRLVEWLHDLGFNDRAQFALFTAVVHTGCYVFMAGFYLFCEMNGFLMQYKFKRKDHQVPTRAMLKQLFKEAAIGQLISGPITAYLMFPVFIWTGMPALNAALPSFKSLYIGFCTSMMVNELGFYWSHRMVHHPKLYGWIHKQHHTFSGSVSVAAEFAHPIEQLVSNNLPTVGGMMFFGCHGQFLIFLIWLVERLRETYEGHSGFCFYNTLAYKLGLSSSVTCAYHDFHHTGNRGNFGSFWTDWLFGTMDAWVELGGTEGYIEKVGFVKPGAPSLSKTPVPPAGFDGGSRRKSE